MFVRGGYVWSGDYMDRVGYLGGYWSSVGYNDTYALSFSFYAGYVSSMLTSGYRYSGQSLRCVALGG